LNTIESLECDLLECGVPFADVHTLGNRYARALETRSTIDWIELYVGIFATVRRSVHRMQTASEEALSRILLLLNDDLGTELFEEEARAELAQAGGVSRPMR
jgi:hypothetical protein